VVNIGVILVLAVYSLAIIANSMTKPLEHDEQMYCTGAVLLAQGKMIYRDFSYVAQMPYHPLLCAAIFRLLNTTYYLLVVRALSAICDVLIIFLIVGIYRQIFRSLTGSAMLFGLAAVTLYLFNPFVDYANGFAWNHDVVMLLVIASFSLFLSIDFNHKSRFPTSPTLRRTGWKLAIIGALLTLATCMRITTVLVQWVFLIFMLVRAPGNTKQKFYSILPFLAASAAVSVWPIWVIFLAPRAFYLNLLRIPALNGWFLHSYGMAYGKLDLIVRALTTPSYALLILLAVCLLLGVLWQWRNIKISNIANLLFSVTLVIVFCIIAFIPLTMWKQYLAMPVPFIVISFAFPLLYLRTLSENSDFHKLFRAARTLIAACALAAIASFPYCLQRIPGLLHPEKYVPIQLHNLAQQIGQRTISPPLVLTLAPLYALEGCCEIYPQFSSGPFVYRIAPYLSPADCLTAIAVTPDTLKQLVKDRPPSTLLLGAEPKFLEESLYNAVDPDLHTWDKERYDDGLIVFYRR
jgi:hypothetical protein